MESTTSVDLIHALSKTPNFLDVFASDTLPLKIRKFPVSLIVNLDKQSQKGSHWVAIFIDGARTGYYFDSYGLPPFLPSIRRFLSYNCRKWTYGRRQLQSIDSSVCGQYCVLYLIHRNKKKSTKAFLKAFTRNSNLNDYKVSERFFNHMRRMYAKKKCKRSLF